MKKLSTIITMLLTLMAMLFALGTMAQKIEVKQQPEVVLKNDTLYVTPGSCKIIKIGDKVYKLTITIDEVQEGFKSALQFYNGGSVTPAINSTNLRYDISPYIKQD
jgi:hypothetical protein